MSTKPAPTEDNGPDTDEHFPQQESTPSCPVCGAENPKKNGTYQRHPHGEQSVRMQQYHCPNGDSFSESLGWIKDGYRYPNIIIRLCLAVFILTDVSLETIQDIVTITFGERPSTQRIHEWAVVANGVEDDDEHRESTDYGELVTNELPTYSGVYTYDEEYIEVDYGRAYRLTLFDSLMNAPVAEMIVGRCTKDAVTDFLTTALADKPIYTVTTDGRSDYAEIIEEKLGELVDDESAVEHHRCSFHFLGNIDDALERELESVHHSPAQKRRIAIVTTEFKEVLRAKSYASAVCRFEDVLGKVEPLPPKIEDYVMDVMNRFDTFAGHLRDEWVPGTTNDCEQYYSHTQAAQRMRRLQSPEQVNAVSWQQQRIRTIKQGWISREKSVELAQEVFPGISPDAVEMLFVESKDRYLQARDLEAD